MRQGLRSGSKIKQLRPAKTNINVRNYISTRTENNRTEVKRDRNASFGLNTSLDQGALSLAPEENIIASISSLHKNFTFNDYLYFIGTFGFYYLYRICYRKEQLKQNLYVTNERIILKEEMMIQQGLF
jgi:hypothetical protein